VSEADLENPIPLRIYVGKMHVNLVMSLPYTGQCLFARKLAPSILVCYLARSSYLLHQVRFVADIPCRATLYKARARANCRDKVVNQIDSGAVTWNEDISPYPVFWAMVTYFLFCRYAQSLWHEATVLHIQPTDTTRRKSPRRAPRLCPLFLLRMTAGTKESSKSAATC
jgi:hypothetical protein